MQETRRLTLHITQVHAGARVDTLLRKVLHLSSAAVRRVKYLPGGITLDGETVFTNALVKPGQLLSVRLGDLPSPGALRPMPGPLNIVYEDDDVLVVDKPAPLAVHPGPGNKDASLVNYLLYYYQQIGLIAQVHPVSRLDSGTSGLLLVAKHAHAHARMIEALHTKAFTRRYLAVCEGAPPAAVGCVDLPIGRMPGQVLRRMVCADGAPARTQYETLRTGNGRSLLALTLDTGRTHQIRVHMAAQSCPLAGDFLYGQELATLPGRFALHAASLSFCHPLSGRAIVLESPLPESLAALLIE